MSGMQRDSVGSLFKGWKPVSSGQLAVMILWLWALASPAGYAADAEPLPPEAEIQRQQERERALRERIEPAPDVRTPQAPRPSADALPTNESPCFTIQQIILTGDNAELFQWALDRAQRDSAGNIDLILPRCLGAGAINLIMRRMQNAVIARGYVTTRILAQPQDLTGGTLQLTVIPGRVRNIRKADGSKGNVRYALPIRTGEILNLRDLEQALENFRRVPTVQSNLRIEPATETTAQPGESDVVIDWHESFPLRLTLSADDSGSDTTGKYLGNVTVSADNWFNMNDLFYVNLMRDLGGGQDGDRGTEGRTLHYSFPLGYWLFSFTQSDNAYHQTVAGLNQNYIYSGNSNNSELKASRLLYRDTVRKLTVSASGWTRASRNFIDDTEVEVQRRRMAGWSAGVTYSHYLGRALLDVGLDFRRGTGAGDSLAAPEEPFDEGTSRPEILLSSTRFSLPFSVHRQALRFSTQWRVQWNLTPLVPQDNFSIGSRYTVRGFDGEFTLAADRGWLTRNELGWQPGQWGQELYIGLDYGRVGGADAERLLGRELAGAVLGMRGGWRWLNYELFAGQPLKKPDGFTTASTASGFNITLSF